MKAIIVVALLVTGAPALAASGSDSQASASRSGGKICTRLQRRGGSRLAYQRVCLTEAEWRDRLGQDWRAQLSGRTPEDDLETVDTRARDWSNVDGDTGVANQGRPQ